MPKTESFTTAADYKNAVGEIKRCHERRRST